MPNNEEYELHIDGSAYQMLKNGAVQKVKDPMLLGEIRQRHRDLTWFERTLPIAASKGWDVPPIGVRVRPEEKGWWGRYWRAMQAYETKLRVLPNEVHEKPVSPLGPKDPEPAAAPVKRKRQPRKKAAAE